MSNENYNIESRMQPIQIKRFYTSVTKFKADVGVYSDCDNDINAWFEQNPNIEIIRQSEKFCDGIQIITIFYRKPLT